MLARLLLFIFILFCLELGLFVFLLPWSGLWEHNYFLFRYPELAAYLLDNRLRGVISGLGLVDIGIAFWYIANFRRILASWRDQATPPASTQPSESVSRGQTA
jgi:hypothetical protein